MRFVLRIALHDGKIEVKGASERGLISARLATVPEKERYEHGEDEY